MMQGMPRLAFAAALTVILSLTLLLTLLLLLLAHLFCSLLIRRRSRSPKPSPGPTGPTDKPLGFPFYAHGVLQAPAELLLSVPSLEEAIAAVPHSPKAEAYNKFVRISNPVYDGTAFVTAMDEEVEVVVDECSPPLKVMGKLPPVLPGSTWPARLVDGRRSFATSTETNRPSSSFSSNSMFSSPSRLELTR